jgi:hypothetical protein
MITEMIAALKAGQELKQSGTWRQLQVASNALVAIVGAALMVLGWLGFRPDISAEQVAAVCGGIAALGGIYNSYTTVATDKRIGVGMQPRTETPQPTNIFPNSD